MPTSSTHALLKGRTRGTATPTAAATSPTPPTRTLAYPKLAPVEPKPVPAPATSSPRPSSRPSLPTYIDVSDRSEWIDGFGYHNTYFAVFFKSGSATLYRGVPAQVPGLLTAGHTNAKADGEPSVGATYNRLVKGVYEGQTISEPEKVAELRKLMGGEK